MYTFTMVGRRAYTFQVVSFLSTQRRDVYFAIWAV